MDCRIKSGNDDPTVRSDLFDFELPTGSAMERVRAVRESQKWEAHFAESWRTAPSQSSSRLCRRNFACPGASAAKRSAR